MTRASCQIRKIVGCACTGIPGTLSPPPWVSDPDMHHGTSVTHVPWCMPGSLTRGFLWNRCRGKLSRHSRRMRNPQFYVSGKRFMAYTSVDINAYWNKLQLKGVETPRKQFEITPSNSALIRVWWDITRNWRDDKKMWCNWLKRPHTDNTLTQYQTSGLYNQGNTSLDAVPREIRQQRCCGQWFIMQSSYNAVDLSKKKME